MIKQHLVLVGEVRLTGIRGKGDICRQGLIPIEPHTTCELQLSRTPIERCIFLP
jgi:hypothetical protein